MCLGSCIQLRCCNGFHPLQTRYKALQEHATPPTPLSYPTPSLPTRVPNCCSSGWLIACPPGCTPTDTLDCASTGYAYYCRTTTIFALYPGIPPSSCTVPCPDPLDLHDHPDRSPPCVCTLRLLEHCVGNRCFLIDVSHHHCVDITIWYDHDPPSGTPALPVRRCHGHYPSTWF